MNQQKKVFDFENDPFYLMMKRLNKIKFPSFEEMIKKAQKRKIESRKLLKIKEF